MGLQDETKVVERAILTKFEERELFLENLRFLLSVDLSQDPDDEGSRLESLRLHHMELTVRVCTHFDVDWPLRYIPLCFSIDKQFSRAALPLGSIPRGDGTSDRGNPQKSRQSSLCHRS